MTIALFICLFTVCAKSCCFFVCDRCRDRLVHGSMESGAYRRRVSVHVYIFFMFLLYCNSVLVFRVGFGIEV